MKKVILYFAFLIAQCSFLVSPAGAQGMVSEIKVFALNEYKEWYKERLKEDPDESL